LSELKCGAIWNPYHINKNGGYFGEGPYGKRSHIKIYNSWSKMLERNTIEGQLSNRRNASYSNCSVCNRWLNYQNFAYWYDKYSLELNPLLYDDYQLHKDILQWNQPYKVYSPETCCLVPSEINNALGNMHLESTFNKGLPPGVKNTKYGKYETNVSIRGKLTHFGIYNTAEEAFEVYKRVKKGYIMELANEYYLQHGITENIWRALYNLEIMPFIV